MCLGFQIPGPDMRFNKLHRNTSRAEYLTNLLGVGRSIECCTLGHYGGLVGTCQSDAELHH
jgi:hypothetical protein